MAKTVKPKQRSTLKPTKKKMHTRTQCLQLAQKLCKLRELNEYGRLWCISCGQPLQLGDVRTQGGHYIGRADRATETEPDNLWPQCSACVTSDTPILMADFTWEKQGDIKVGDKLLAFEELAQQQTYRRYKVATVTSAVKRIEKVYEVELENGDTVKTTADHKWLGRHGKMGTLKWVETQNFWVDSRNLKGKRITGSAHEHTYSTVCKLIDVVEKEDSYEAGWLAGMVDADGHVTQQIGRDSRVEGVHCWGFRVGIAQCEKYPNICEQIVRLMKKYTGREVTVQLQKGRSIINSTCKTFQFLANGSNMKKLELLQRTRPNKISKVDINKIGKIRAMYDVAVRSITPAGEQEIVVMETDTHTFIANGYAMHNCNVLKNGNIPMFRYNLVRLIGSVRVERLEYMSLARRGDAEALALLSPADRVIATQKKSARYYDSLYYELKEDIKRIEEELNGQAD